MEFPSFEAPDGCFYENPAEYLWTGVMGGCGCGDGSLPDLAVEVLRYFSTMQRDWNEFTREMEIIAHWFDSLDLIDHGSSIRGSWLTDKGKTVLATLDKEGTHNG
jgi:hypothetical protein